MQRTILSALILCVMLLAGTSALAAPKAPVDLMLGPPEGMKASKALVAFPHSRHEAANLDCVTCHHTWNGQSDIKKCGTAGCHDQAGKKEVNTFYAAFHDKNAEFSCLGCHKTVMKEGREVPVACKSCHAK